MSTLSLVTSRKTELEAEAQSWAVKARDLRITDAESCTNAGLFLRSIKGLRQDIARWFAPHVEGAMETKRKAEAARKALVDDQARMEAPLVAAETTVKRALLVYEQEQEQARRDEEARLQAEAQRQAETITLNAAAQLEREAARTGDEEMRQEAADILAQPIEAPVVSVARTVPKVQGVTYRDQWKAHVDVNIVALAAAVGAGQVSPTFLSVNMTALNQFARATQGAQPVPGVRFWNDRQIAAKA